MSQVGLDSVDVSVHCGQFTFVQRFGLASVGGVSRRVWGRSSGVEGLAIAARRPSAALDSGASAAPGQELGAGLACHR
jgi:hypothetical protein